MDDEEPTFQEFWTAGPDEADQASVADEVMRARVPPRGRMRWRVPLWNRAVATIAGIPFVAFGIWISAAMIYWYFTDGGFSFAIVIFYLVVGGGTAVLLGTLISRLLWVRLSADEVGLTVRNGRSITLPWAEVAGLVPGERFLTIVQGDGGAEIRSRAGAERFGELRQWGRSAEVAAEVAYLAEAYGWQIPVADYRPAPAAAVTDRRTGRSRFGRHGGGG